MDTIETLRAAFDDLARRYELLDRSEKDMAAHLRTCQAARGVLVCETANAREERDKAQSKILAVREAVNWFDDPESDYYQDGQKLAGHIRAALERSEK